MQTLNKDLETIVYVASHNLRSPLVNVQGFSNELARACERVKTRLADTPGTFVEKKELLSLLSEEVPEALSFKQPGLFISLVQVPEVNGRPAG